MEVKGEYQMMTIESKQPAMPMLSHRIVVIPKDTKVKGLLPTRLAVQTGVSEPLDADTVTELDWRVLSVCADGNDDTDTLSAAQVSKRAMTKRYKDICTVPRVLQSKESLRVLANLPWLREDLCGRHPCSQALRDILRA